LPLKTVIDPSAAMTSHGVELAYAGARAEAGGGVEDSCGSMKTDNEDTGVLEKLGARAC
jgi:hypothetical protein